MERKEQTPEPAAAPTSWLITYQSELPAADWAMITSTMIIKEHPAIWLMKFKKRQCDLAGLDERRERRERFHALVFALPLTGFSELEVKQMCVEIN